MQYAIHRFETVTSTNDLAIEMAAEAAPEGTVVVADEQSEGRGRRGRHWVSPPGAGVYLSILLRPGMPSDRFWQLAFVASLAAAEGIRRASHLEARVKWPNDVLVNSRKVCGILVEARISSTGFGSVAVVGIGVNVNTTDFPLEFAETATSLASELGEPVSRQVVERDLLEAFRARYEQYRKEGFRPILDAWKTVDSTVGRDVTVQTDQETVEGTAVEVNVRGNLVVRARGGVLREVSAGDVLLLG